MGVWDYVILAAVAAAVTAAVVSVVVSKKRGKSSCGCGCGSPSCSGKQCAGCGFYNNNGSKNSKGD